MLRSLIVGFAGCAVVASTATAASTSFDVNLEGWGVAIGPVWDASFALDGIQSIDSVSIELSHSWASDVVLTLSNTNGDTFELMTGLVGGNNNFGTGDGTLGDVVTYNFIESGGDDLVSTFDDNDYAAGDYNAQSWVSGPFAADTWTIALADDAPNDDGAVGTVTINYTVPTPGAASLAAIAGLAAVRRRR